MTINPPDRITISGRKHSYKCLLSGNKVSYRCIHRSKCKVSLHIDKDELFDQSNTNIIPKKIVNEHACSVSSTTSNMEIAIEKEQEYSEIQKKALYLISLNHTKEISWHINNIKMNNIELTDNQIKYLLHKYRSSTYPNDIEYLKGPFYIKNKINKEGENNEEPLCFSYNKFYNPTKKKIEAFLIYASYFI